MRKQTRVSVAICWQDEINRCLSKNSQMSYVKIQVISATDASRWYQKGMQSKHLTMDQEAAGLWACTNAQHLLKVI